MEKIRSTKSEARNKSETCLTTAKKIGGQMPTLRFYHVLDFDFRSFDIHARFHLMAGKYDKEG